MNASTVRETNTVQLLSPKEMCWDEGERA